MSRIAVALLIAVAVPGMALAQHDTTSSVFGTVKDSAGRPMRGIEVYVLTSGRGAHSGEDGRYAITSLLEGPTRLRVRSPGWAPFDTSIVIRARSRVQIDFIVKRRLDQLDTVRVVSQDDCARHSFDGFECRRKAGIGMFRDSAEIAAQKPVFWGDMFDGIAGLKRVPTRLDVGIQSTTGWRCIALLVNGQYPPRNFDTRHMLFEDLMGFEFYDSEEKVPEWYKIRARHCSLVVLWTKGAPMVADPADGKKPPRPPLGR